MVFCLTLWVQWAAGVAVMTMMFVIGLSIGWSSPYLAQFESGNSPFPATKDEVSWMALGYQLGRLLGAILGAVCVQYFGSKTSLSSNGCALLISWILVIVSNSVSWIYLSRFIFGVSFEVAIVSFPFYLGDISSSKIRGALVTFAVNGLVIGILAGNAMGNYLSMKLFAWVSLVPNICFLVVFVWIPNSPYYLTSKGKTEDAERSILRYNPKANVSLEMECNKEFLAVSKSKTFIDQLREFNIPRNRKTAIIVTALAMFTQFSGLNPLTAYMESIMTRSMVTVIAPSTVPIIANSIGIIAGWTVMYFVEKFGRRKMWVVSCAGICGSITVLGIHFYLLDDGVDPTRLQWLPIFSMVLFKISYHLGSNCIPIILFSELFASNIRPIAGFVFVVFSAISGFLSIYAYQFLLDLMNEAYVWWIHAIIMLVALIFGLMLVPEMKGKTLLEIQGALMKIERQARYFELPVRSPKTFKPPKYENHVETSKPIIPKCNQTV